jgi:hypothetical protein
MVGHGSGRGQGASAKVLGNIGLTTYQWNISPTSVSAAPMQVSVTASSAYSHDSDSLCTHDAFHAAVKSSKITIWITKNRPDPTRAAHSVVCFAPTRETRQ